MAGRLMTGGHQLRQHCDGMVDTVWHPAALGGAGGLDGWGNACHLLSRELTGKGRVSANLSTCTRPSNAMVRGEDRIEVNFRHYEKIVRKAVKDEKVVQYSVTPNYTGDRVVASSWTFNATAWDKNGKQSVLFADGVVRNELGGKNLGLQNDEDGNPVPVR